MDECGRNDMCPSNAFCVNNHGSYACECVYGYHHHENQCIDTDECKLTNCPDMATCINEQGSYRCECDDGFEPINGNINNGCRDINECNSKPCLVNELCVNTIGSFNCDCAMGINQLNNECLDVDECQLGVHSCQPHLECVNKQLGFDCQCTKGFTLVPLLGDLVVDQCVDIDECDDKPCPGECRNTDGSFECECLVGFDKQYNGQCRNIDECESQPCDSEAKCVDTVGSFVCTCNVGYKGDGITCVDINECETEYCFQTCINTVGSWYCACNPDWQKHASSPDDKCTDYDECAENDHTCPDYSVCIDTADSFSCKCRDGFIGTGDKMSKQLWWLSVPL